MCALFVVQSLFLAGVPPTQVHVFILAKAPKQERHSHAVNTSVVREVRMSSFNYFFFNREVYLFNRLVFMIDTNSKKKKKFLVSQLGIYKSSGNSTSRIDNSG